MVIETLSKNISLIDKKLNHNHSYIKQKNGKTILRYSKKKCKLGGVSKCHRYRRRAIGLSWTALFLANGLKVTVNDPRADLEEATLKGLEEIIPTLKALGYDVSTITDKLYFESDLNKAYKDADLIQENGPENLAFKQDLFAQIETKSNRSLWFCLRRLVFRQQHLQKK